MFLLVTLDKGGKAESFQYRDRFLSPTVFQWESPGEEADEIRRGEDGLAVDQLHVSGPSLSIRRGTIRLVGGESWRMSAILRLRRTGA
jgi:hypothetical protein